MRRALPTCGLLLALAVSAAGCRGPEVRLLPAAPTPALPPPTEPAVARPTAIEPDLKTLPLIDPASDAGSVRPAARGVTEAEVGRAAAERALTANLLAAEGGVPRAILTDRDGRPLACSGDSDDSLIREVRALAAVEARNRAAADALVGFFQLADAEGRGEVLRKSVVVMDQLKAAVTDAKAKGAKVPVEPDELDRQRAGVLALLGQADLGAKLLDVDLKRRLGLPGATADRLFPSGDFGMSVPTPDAEAAVATGLGRRADLQALRTVYLRLNTDTLPAAREYLRALPGLAGLIGSGPPQLPALRRASERRMAPSLAALETVLVSEVEARRRQLWAVIEEKERGAADEVRAAVAAVAEQARQVGLARWRAEQLAAKAEDEKKQARGAILEQLAEIDALRARADVIAAVMQWHQARVRLNAATGLYAAGDPAGTAR